MRMGRFRSFRAVRMFRRGIGREVEVVGIFFKVGKISREISQNLAEFRKLRRWKGKKGLNQG